MASRTSEPVHAGTEILSLDDYLKRPDAKFDLKPTDNMGIRVVGNAGDFDAVQFRQIAVELHASLRKKYPVGLTAIDLDAFEKTLDANVVFVNAEIIVNGDPRVAANIPSAKLIVVNRVLWKEQDDPRMKLMIVFHEYLGLMGLDRNNEISSYFLTHSVLPGIIISIVMYQFSDVSEKIDEEEARLTCYKFQLKHYGDLVLGGFNDPKRQKMNHDRLMISLRQFDKFFLISQENLSSTIIYKKYMRIDDLETFVGIKRKSDGSLDASATMRTRGFDVYLNFCGGLQNDYRVGPGSDSFSLCHHYYWAYLSSAQLVPQCRGIMKGSEEPLGLGREKKR